LVTVLGRKEGKRVGGFASKRRRRKTALRSPFGFTALPVAEAFKNHFRKCVEIHLERFYLAVAELRARTEEFPTSGKAQHGSADFSLETPPLDITFVVRRGDGEEENQSERLARSQPCYGGCELCYYLRTNFSIRVTKSRRMRRLSMSA
jgi:hypothetical protein